MDPAIHHFQKLLSKIVIMTVGNERKCGYYNSYVTQKQFEYLRLKFDDEKYDVMNKGSLDRLYIVITNFNYNTPKHIESEISVVSFAMHQLAREKIKDVFIKEITDNNIKLYCIKINKLIINTFDLWKNNNELLKELIRKFQHLQFISDDYIHSQHTVFSFLGLFNNGISNIKYDFITHKTQIDELVKILSNIQS